MTVGDRIKVLRKTIGITQQDMADALALKRSTIATLEIDKQLPSERTISDICRVYGVSRLWLETGEGEMFSPAALDEELAGLMGTLLSDESESFRKRFLSVLLRFGDDEWGLLEKITQELAEMVAQMKKDTEP